MSGSPTCDTENKTEKLSEANLKLRHALRAGGVIIEWFFLISNGISTYNNFPYSDEGLKIWKAYDIGSGRKLPWSTMPGT